MLTGLLHWRECQLVGTVCGLQCQGRTLLIREVFSTSCFFMQLQAYLETHCTIPLCLFLQKTFLEPFIYIRGVKMFPTKISRDVGMVGGVSDATGSCMEKPTGGKCPGTRDTAHHPYISICFCGKHFYSPCSFTFNGVQTAWQVNTSHVYTYKLTLKVYSHKQTAKYVIDYACPRVHYPTHQSGLLPFQQEGNLTVCSKSLIIIDTSATQ